MSKNAPIEGVVIKRSNEANELYYTTQPAPIYASAVPVAVAPIQRKADRYDIFILVSLIALGIILMGLVIGMVYVGAQMLVLYLQYADDLTKVYLQQYFAEAVTLLVLSFLTALCCLLGFIMLCAATRAGYVALAIFTLLDALAMLVLLIVYGATRSSNYSYFDTLWQQNLYSTFTDVQSTSVITLQPSNSYAYLWNEMMFNLGCCGAVSYSDYYSASLWTRTYATYGVVQANIPIWCCRMQSGTEFPTYNPSDTTCLTAPTNANSYASTACNTALLTAVQESTYTTAAIILCAIATALLIIIFAAAIVAIQTKKTYVFIPELEDADCCGRNACCPDARPNQMIIYQNPMTWRSKIAPAPQPAAPPYNPPVRSLTPKVPYPGYYPNPVNRVII